jgi:hypothetical protein
MPLLESGAAVAAGGTAGFGVYKYNRTNYLYDAGLRFSRYTTGYSMACEQAEMYREDIRDLTGFTVAKQDLYHIVGVIFYVITIQLIMAGRLGVHGPVPPGWLMSIHYTVGGLAMMWLTLSTWMAMHASARASAGMVHMLTHTVRLPIPSPAQLDKARKFGNSYEQTRFSDMLRVPFAMPAAGKRGYEDVGSKSKGGKVARPGSKQEAVHEEKRRLPRWYQDENSEIHGGEGEVSITTPEHFDLYRGMQQEWWAHDIYARISLLYFMSNWTHGAAYYIQSHAFGELRAIGVAWSTACVFSATHFALLRIDILSDALKDRPASRLPMEWIAPWTPMLTAFGMSLDYSIITPSAGLRGFIYVIAWIVLLIHVAWALRMYDLAQPSPHTESKDRPSQPWFPSDWWIPTAFQHVLYLMAPPKRVEEGQTCLQQEMRCAFRGGAEDDAKTRGVQTKSKARETLPGLWPFRIFRGALYAMIAVWVMVVIARLWETFWGERKLLKQEGRVERWPSHMQPWMPPWTRENMRDEWAHTGGSDRRLTHTQMTQYEYASHNQMTKPSKDQRRMEIAQRLSTVLEAVSETLDHEVLTPAAHHGRENGITQAAKETKLGPLRQAKVDWPAEFSEISSNAKHLACRAGGNLAALTGEAGTGVAIQLNQAGGTNSPVSTAPLVKFSLQGLAGLGNVIGTSWGDEGLILVTTSGAVAKCGGPPPVTPGGEWRCASMSTQLPTGGSALRLAAVARVPGTDSLRAAVIFEGDESFVLFELAGGSNAWEPAGEARLPPSSSGVVSLSLSVVADKLLISARDGAVFQWSLSSYGASDASGVGQMPPSGAPVIVASPRVGQMNSDLVWRTACALDDGRIAHLAAKGDPLGQHTFPALFLSAMD